MRDQQIVVRLRASERQKLDAVAKRLERPVAEIMRAAIDRQVLDEVLLDLGLRAVEVGG
jgi:predicted DNA-binding protein